METSGVGERQGRTHDPVFVFETWGLMGCWCCRGVKEGFCLREGDESKEGDLCEMHDD